MKTINERAAEYARSTMDRPKMHEESIEIVAGAFAAGAEFEHEELIRWNDPKEVLPETGTQVMIKLKYRNGMICYAIARFSRSESLWFYNLYSVCSVNSILGWRPIYE